MRQLNELLQRIEKLVKNRIRVSPIGVMGLSFGHGLFDFRTPVVNLLSGSTQSLMSGLPSNNPGSATAVTSPLPPVSSHGHASSVNSPAAPTVTDAAAIARRSLLLGLFAAMTYSIANMALRGLSKTDSGPGWDMWVAGTKAFPTFAVAVVLLALRWFRGQTLFAEWQFVWPIAVAALFNQLGGNFCFQVSLRAIGLAISVPICFASIICSGAIVGRIVLNDRVSIRTAISMGLMVASIVFLSVAAKSRSADTRVNEAVVLSEAGVASTALKGSSTAIPTSPAAPLGVVAGVLLSIVSGLCYGITGVFIRKAVRSQMPVEATLFLFSAAGFLVLCPLSLFLLPLQTIADTTSTEWMTIAIAGTFNAMGFYAITHAMKHLTISRANVINASQNAMCAVGAVFFFNESLSMIGLFGIGLTITGLLTLDRR